jgi:hypothetical protein
MAWSFRTSVWGRQPTAASSPKEALQPGALAGGGSTPVGEQWETEMERMKWEQICCQDEFRGRWVALDSCRYDETTGCATEGAVVDADDDLAELCTRIRESEWKNCAILFCAENELESARTRPSQSPPDPFRTSAH